ncbi:hypothetical protein [Tsukamurella pseudospumae]|uniref:Uncharacterized protein n=1 Tax=Tsukamurella pseudospumae TaxID=239498 RepID=A0A137ZRR5_9ACTN|nr:hypothetical protein [Tsukamurella pseudospumae]KXP00874.1 hypothetical protein AXK61_12760 [Tsukamurella pseudospumae]
MSLPWIRLDTNVFDHPKILSLLELDEDDDTAPGRRALALYFFGLTYTGKHELDGFVPRSALRLIGASRADARNLVEVGLWVADGTAGWSTHGWADRQASTEESKARSERARKAAQTRWAKQRDSKIGEE